MIKYKSLVFRWNKRNGQNLGLTVSWQYKPFYVYRHLKNPFYICSELQHVKEKWYV